MKYLQIIGIDKIVAHEHFLNEFLTKQLLNWYENTGWFKIFGPQDASQKGGILSFEMRRLNVEGIAEEPSEKANIMVRDGTSYVHSYLNDTFGPEWRRPKSPG